MREYIYIFKEDIPEEDRVKVQELSLENKVAITRIHLQAPFVKQFIGQLPYPTGAVITTKDLTTKGGRAELDVLMEDRGLKESFLTIAHIQYI